MFDGTEKEGGITWEVWPSKAMECGNRSDLAKSIPEPTLPWQLFWPLTPGVLISGNIVLRLKLTKEPV